MIQYEPARSPFYIAHEQYCRQIETLLSEHGSIAQGYCNSFGYEMTSVCSCNGIHFNLHWQKHQTTQNGVVIPVDSNEYAGLEINSKDIRSANSISFGNNILKRRLYRRSSACFPSPLYYHSSLGPVLSDQSVKDMIFEIKCDTLRVRDGDLKVYFHTAIPSFYPILVCIIETLKLKSS